MLRTKDFSILAALILDSVAKGRLYLDDGISTVIRDATTEVASTFNDRTIYMTVLESGYDADVGIAEFVILGQLARPTSCVMNYIPIRPDQQLFN